MADDKTVAALAAAIKSLQGSIDGLGNSKGDSGDTLFDRAENLDAIEDDRMSGIHGATNGSFSSSITPLIVSLYFSVSYKGNG